MKKNVAVLHVDGTKEYIVMEIPDPEPAPEPEPEPTEVEILQAQVAELQAELLRIRTGG